MHYIDSLSIPVGMATLYCNIMCGNNGEYMKPDNTMIDEEIWKEQPPRRCKRCGRKMDDCSCDYID